MICFMIRMYIEEVSALKAFSVVVSGWSRTGLNRLKTLEREAQRKEKMNETKSEALWGLLEGSSLNGNLLKAFVVDSAWIFLLSPASPPKAFSQVSIF